MVGAPFPAKPGVQYGFTYRKGGAKKLVSLYERTFLSDNHVMTGAEFT
jgi:hypothetical protein